MSKAKRKTTTPTKPTKDQRIIEACVLYYTMEQAVAGAFKADPDPNNVNAEKVDDAYWKHRQKALKAAGASAETVPGIRAKVRTLSLMFEQEKDMGKLEGPRFDFAASVARDVEAMLSKWIDEQGPAPVVQS